MQILEIPILGLGLQIPEIPSQICYNFHARNQILTKMYLILTEMYSLVNTTLTPISLSVDPKI